MYCQKIDLIESKGYFERSNICIFATFWHISQKEITFSFFCIQLLGG